MPYPRRDARVVARERSLKAKWSRVRFRDNRTVLPGDGLGGLSQECWCGAPMNHKWPGIEEGEPHPVPREVIDLPPKVQAREAQLLLQASGVCPICRGYPGLSGCKTCLGTGEFPPPKTRPSKKPKEAPDG